MAIETERKYLDVDFDALRETLTAVGAEHKGSHFESNIIFDTVDGRLFASRQLLRVRQQEWRDGTVSLLTFKKPVATASQGEFKEREEYELSVENDIAMARVLEGLGFQATARYEKVRSEWELALPGGRALVALDELPFARVVEVEASPGILDAVASRLGLDKYEISTKSYHELHQEWRSAQGLQPKRSFVFGPDEWRRFRRRIGLSVPPETCL
ncbi:MAG: class IV adenylate cyclase [Desulfovibrio sp.]|nr:class IV adenylate cyclase [Desulfovibrio sp.]